MVVPARTSAPAVFFGFSAHMNAAATQWSAPVTPGGGSAERECRPLRIVVCSRTDSSGFQLKGSSPVRGPTFSGTQYPGAPPCGTNRPTNRGFGLAAVWASAVRAGTIASRNGSAITAPAPRRIVRRGMCFLEINMVTPSPLTCGPVRLGGGGRLLVHLERRALDDARHKG